MFGNKSLRIILAFFFLSLASSFASELVVCWGDTGETPAVALLLRRQEPIVLLPGGSADGRMMAWFLESQGRTTVAELVMPTSAPFPRGASSLAKKCTVRQLTVVREASSRTRWTPLRDALVAQGTAVCYRAPVAGKVWRFATGEYQLEYRRGEAGEAIRLSVWRYNKGGELLPQFCCRELRTGLFVISASDEAPPFVELPKSNRSGYRRISLPE